MNISFPNGWEWSGLVAVPYSFGLGQICAAPGSIASAITSIFFGCKQLSYHCRMKATHQADKKAVLKDKKISAKNHALNSAAATVFFVVGAIPAIGGPLGVYCAYKIHKHHEKNSKNLYH